MPSCKNSEPEERNVREVWKKEAGYVDREQCSLLVLQKGVQRGRRDLFNWQRGYRGELEEGVWKEGR